MPKAFKVVLDTNFLMIPGQLKVDIFQELQKGLYFPFELYCASGSIKELEKLAQEGKMVDRRAAKVALQMVSKYGIKLIDTGDQHVDDALVKLGDDYIIATQDTGLKRRLTKYVYLRQKKYIESKGL